MGGASKESARKDEDGSIGSKGSEEIGERCAEISDVSGERQLEVVVATAGEWDGFSTTLTARTFVYTVGW